MESFKCSIHEEKSIIGFCVNKQCLSQRSCCLRCLQEFHTEHPKEIIELGDLNKWIQPNNQALSKIQQQIKDIEYVVQIVKLSFENYMKYLTLNKNNLNLIIQASLNLDLKQTQFIKVIVCLREFSRNIIRINSQIDNLISKDQGEELIKQKKWDQSIEYFTQLLEQENLKKKLSLSQQTVITLFNCFELEEKSKRIDPLKHKSNLKQQNSNIKQTDSPEICLHLSIIQNQIQNHKTQRLHFHRDLLYYNSI